MIEIVLITHQGKYFSPGKILKLKHIVALDEMPPRYTRVKTLCGLSRLVSHIQGDRARGMQVCAKCKEASETHKLGAELICPQLVPIQLLIILGRAGIGTTEQVHAHITAGTLRTLPGIGPARERKIIAWYTKDGLKPSGVIVTKDGHGRVLRHDENMIEAQLRSEGPFLMLPTDLVEPVLTGDNR